MESISLVLIIGYLVTAVGSLIGLSNKPYWGRYSSIGFGIAAAGVSFIEAYHLGVFEPLGRLFHWLVSLVVSPAHAQGKGSAPVMDPIVLSLVFDAIVFAF